MSKELYNQIIDEAYENFRVKVKDTYFPVYRTKDEFIDTVKNYPEFSKKWGIQIEERELSLEERYTYSINKIISDDVDGLQKTLNAVNGDESIIHQLFDNHNIPTKEIKVTYNNETITVYE